LDQRNLRHSSFNKQRQTHNRNLYELHGRPLLHERGFGMFQLSTAASEHMRKQRFYKQRSVRIHGKHLFS
jgi:hypothetical protein